MIVNGNEGSVQTTDIEVDVGKNIWLVVTDEENYTLTYEEPVSDLSGTPEKKSSLTEKTTMWIILGIVAVVGVASLIIVAARKKSNRV